MTALSLLRPPKAAAIVAAVATTLLAAGLLSAAAGAAAAEVPSATPGTTAAATAAAPAGRYFAIPPTRVLATRDIGRPFGQGEVRTVDLSKAFTASASAVVINLTAAYGSSDSYQTAYPTGVVRPYASSLNELAGEVRANSVTVAVGQGGANQNKIDLFNFSGNVQLVVDVVGYYGNGGAVGRDGTSFSPLSAPVRIFDTRSSIGPLTTTAPKNVGIVTVDYQTPEVNRAIRSLVMNITVTAPQTSGYLALWDGSGALPKTSTLNYKAGQTTANMAIVPVRCTDLACSSVTFSILNAYSPSVQVIGDIQGMYAVPGQPGALTYQPVSPTRIVDTRYGNPYGQLGAGTTAMTPASTWGANARAVNMNVTGVQPQVQTYLTVWAAGPARPPTSNVNIQPGNTTPNAVQMKLGGNGSGFAMFNAAGAMTVVIDLAGTFVTDPGPLTGAPAKGSPSASGDAGTVAVTGGITGL